MKSLARTILAAAGIATAGWANSAHAAYPDHAVTIVISADPGSGNDAITRVIAAKLSQKWGQPVIVLNKVSANQTIAEDYMVNAKPDGYTLMFENNQRTLNAAINDPKAGYDVAHGFAPVTEIDKQPMVIVANNDLPTKTLADVLKFAKANPNKITYGDIGKGSTLDLTFRRLEKAADAQLYEVPYKAAGEMLIGLAGGEINIAMANPVILSPFIQGHKVTPIAITDTVRSPTLPDVPTVTEALGNQFIYSTWYGVFAPAGTPKDVLAKLQADIVEALNMPEVKDPLVKQGLTVVGNKTDEFEGVVRDETAGWRSVISPAK